MNRKLKLLLFVLSITLVILACSLGGSDPTPTQPPPPPTHTPVSEPTDVPEAPPEPTDIPEPTNVPDTPQEPAADNELSILAVNGYRDDFDSLRIVGLITNNTDRAVDNVEIEIEIFDANDVSLYSEVTYSELNTLAPGETSPFALWVFDDLPDADSYVATIVGQSSAEVDRAILDTYGEMIIIDDDGDINITGAFINNSDQPVQISGLAAATFDADGNLSSADGYSVSIRYLDPGEDGPFRISITGPGEDAPDSFDYTLYVDAEFVDEEDFYDLTFSDQTNYTDAYDNFHLVGEVTNNSDTNLSISLVAAIYDADGNVVDAASTDVPFYGLPPGETIAYDFGYWGPLNYKAGLINAGDSYSVQWDPYWTWESYTEYVPISTANDDNEFDGWSGIFVGNIVNDSGTTLDGATVVISLYDIETGIIFAMGYDTVFDEIPVDGTAEYKVYVDLPEDFDITTVEFYITAKGELP